MKKQKSVDLLNFQAKSSFCNIKSEIHHVEIQYNLKK